MKRIPQKYPDSDFIFVVSLIKNKIHDIEIGDYVDAEPIDNTLYAIKTTTATFQITEESMKDKNISDACLKLIIDTFKLRG
jgi:hypothetical protein